MKRDHKTFFFFLLILILLAFPLYKGEAEENETSSYEPPPMFGTMETPVVSRPVETIPAINLDSSESILGYPIIRSETEITKKTEKKRFIAKRPAYESLRKPIPPQPKKKPVYIAKKVEKKKEAPSSAQALLDAPVIPSKKPYHKTKARIKTARNYTSDDGPIMPAVPPKPVEKDSLPDAIETVGENRANITPFPTQETVSLDFETGQAELADSMLSVLNETVLKALRRKRSTRVQIMAYAKPVKDSFNNARRLSLARALAVREYFLQNGIEAKRIDVRGMGMQNQTSPADRVDLILID